MLPSEGADWQAETRAIRACYSTAAVNYNGTLNALYAGGFVGYNFGGTIIASYTTGPVSGTGTGGIGQSIGGFAGLFTSSGATITNSYCDTQATKQTSCIGGTGPGVSGTATPATTSALRMPTGYTGIYMNWNISVDGDSTPDDPWAFGATDQYPVLKFGRDAATIAAQFAAQPVRQVRGVSVAPGPGGLVVSWTAVPGATGYKVQWKSGDEDYDPAERQVLIDDGSASRVTIPHLAVGKSYTVRVIAMFANADEELASDEVTGIPRELNTTPIFIDAVDVQRYQQGTEIDPLTLPTPIDGNGTLTYRLTALPEGLVFDAETLIISGTPLEAMDGTTYTLTATDEDGDKGTLQFILVVIADRMSSFGDTTATAPVYVQNRASDPLTLPQAIGGDGTLTYALTPDLPEGLKFDAETLVISGMSLEAMAETTYTLTATDEDGDESLLTFTLEVMADLMPTFGDTTVAAQNYLVNREIESLTLPQATSGDGTLAYFLLPFLPDGLSFDPATRTIAGTPTEAKSETTYTLTALDADGDLASLTFTLDVQMPSPDFNGDGNVNFADFILFAGKFGSRLGQERYDARCDLNADGQIDVADFLIFAASFGATG